MYAPTVHCTDCSTAITLAAWQATPTYCPYCASQSLQSDVDYNADTLRRNLQHEVNRWANGTVVRHLTSALVHHPADELLPNDNPSTWEPATTIELTPQLVTILQARFRQQHAFISFTEYVVCMLTAKPPATKGERETDERARAAKLR